MRTRFLKPGFFANDILAECEPLARLLFAGMWCYADREGRFEFRVKKLKAEILPYDEGVSIEDLVAQLARGGFVEVYEVDNTKYIQIVNFAKHQNPHMKETASTIPAPNEHQPRSVLAPTQTGTSPALTLNPLTLTLNPSCNARAISEIEVPEEISPTGGPELVEEPAPSQAKVFEADFEVWYAGYPHKVGRAAARVKYLVARRKGTSAEVLLIGRDRYIATKPPDREWCNPATFLNQERWLDQPALKVTDNARPIIVPGQFPILSIPQQNGPKSPPPKVSPERLRELGIDPESFRG